MDNQINQQLLHVNSDNGIPPTLLEILFSCLPGFKIWNYRLSRAEANNLGTLKHKFSQSFLKCKESSWKIFNSLKMLCDKIFEDDKDYQELISRPNQNEKTKNLLNYMGFLFEDCYYDVLGAGCIIEDILEEGRNQKEFCNDVLTMVNKQEIPFGQTFGHLIYCFKIFLKLDSHCDDKQKIGNLSRKQFKKFANIYLNSDSTQKIFNLIYELFHSLINVNSTKDIDKSIENALNKLGQALETCQDEKQIISFLKSR